SGADAAGPRRGRGRGAHGPADREGPRVPGDRCRLGVQSRPGRGHGRNLRALRRGRRGPGVLDRSGRRRPAGRSRRRGRAARTGALGQEPFPDSLRRRCGHGRRARRRRPGAVRGRAGQDHRRRPVRSRGPARGGDLPAGPGGRGDGRGGDRPRPRQGRDPPLTWPRHHPPSGSVTWMTSPAADPFADSSDTPGFSDFSDTDAFLRLPRLAAVTASEDGRVVAAIQEADEPGARLVPSLWELDPSGRSPARRLTFSARGESAPRFAPDGSLLFSSSRPDPEGGSEDEVAAIWRLPRTGEAQVVASAAADLSLLSVAGDGTMLAATSVLPGSSLEEDAERRRTRRDAKRTTIWHTGKPIRQWDHELGDRSRRLVLVSADG